MNTNPTHNMKKFCLFAAALAFGTMPGHSQPAPTNVAKYADPPMSGPIRYINPSKPEVGKPNYPGRRYEALAPATLDLSERGGLAIHAMTEALNPNCDYEAYILVHLRYKNPWMYHNVCDLIRTKYFHLMPLLRTMSGSAENLAIEQRLMEIFLQMQGPDGLIYTPMVGRPWALPADRSEPGAGVGKVSGDQFACLTFDNGRALAAFSVFAQKYPDGPWREAARRLADGLKKWIHVEGDVACLYDTWTEPGKPLPATPVQLTVFPGSLQGWTAQGLSQYGRLLGDKESLDLAAKLMRKNMRDPYFGPNGEFMAEGHFHAHVNQVLSSLEVVAATGDKELLERSLKAYEYGKSRGQALVGFFPEHVRKNEADHTSEICQVGDMVMAAIMLSNLGIDRWDDADRWVRNQLTESQMLQTHWLTDGNLAPSEQTHPTISPLFQPGSIGTPVPRESRADGVITAEATGSFNPLTIDHVAERTIGSFAGWPSPNDLDGRPENCTFMNCCLANGSKGLWYAWKNILTHDQGRLRVNLLLNRASQWADVDSHIPYTGRVDVSMKETLSLEVRIPEWVQPEQVRCEVGGNPRSLTFDGRYAKPGEVKAGQKAVFSFPITERTVKTEFPGNLNQGRLYTMVIRGNDVVKMDPPGTSYPLYQRSHYRTGETLYRKAKRFVPDQEMNW